MKSHKLTLLVIFAFTISLAVGQDYTFKVMANKGSTEIKSGNAWQPIKTGASLREGDELKLAANSYVGLIHVSGKPLEVKEAGSYKVIDLAAKVTGGSSALNKYADFILSSNADDKKNKLSATGAVHRATELQAIKIMLPDSQNAGIYNDDVVIKWDAGKTTGPYIVRLSNLFEDSLRTVETTENYVRIDLSQPGLVNVNAFRVEVSVKGDPKQNSKVYTIKRLVANDREKVKKLLADFSGQVTEPTAINYYIKAGFYESQGLIIDALTAYEDAVKLESAFEEDYTNFLIRTGFKAPQQ